MAAEAAVGACEDCDCAVVPTKTVLQAFSAMFVADAEGSLDDNVAEMNEAIGQIRDGEVTTAVRDSSAADGSPIHSGDVMGFQHLIAAIEEAQPDLEIDSHRGEQPLYPVIFSIE